MRRLNVRLVVVTSVLSALCAAHVVRAEAAERRRPGRVEGALRIGAKPGAYKEVILERNDPMPTSRPPARKPNVEPTDGDGRFVFKDVEPGEWRVGIFKRYTIRNKRSYTRGATSSHAVRFGLAPGQTVRVQIGGTGRPVIGRLVPPSGSTAKLAYQGGSARRIWLNCPPTPYSKDLPEDKRTEWLRKWYRTEAGMASWRARYTYVVDVEPDGSFRIEDVPAGSYTGCIEVARWGERLGRADGQAFLKFTVPEIPGGRSDEPLDIGACQVKLDERKGLKVGGAARASQATSAEGGTPSRPVNKPDF